MCCSLLVTNKNITFKVPLKVAPSEFLMYYATRRMCCVMHVLTFSLLSLFKWYLVTQFNRELDDYARRRL